MTGAARLPTPWEIRAAIAEGICPEREILHILVSREAPPVVLLRAALHDPDEAEEPTRLAFARLLPWAAALAAFAPESWDSTYLEFAPSVAPPAKGLSRPAPVLADADAVVAPILLAPEPWDLGHRSVRLRLVPSRRVRTAEPDAAVGFGPEEARDPRVVAMARLAETGAMALVRAWAPWFEGVSIARTVFSWPAPSGIRRLAARRNLPRTAAP